MVEQFDFEKIDTMSLPDLERLLMSMDTIKDPFGITVMRRYLMRSVKAKTSTEVIDSLQSKIITASIETMAELATTKSMPYKFVRENKKTIIFKDKPGKLMHIHYALAAGMYLPQDGGSLACLNNKKTFQLSGNSSSLHIPPYDNPARQVSLEILRPSIPAGFKLITS
ncbi:hypothetical protein CANDROIZ_50002 [Candidatus Roizmanbacteria bacterium]|nr:hypothetical protein CANDROIZ_50002 [Candidatus Roizmanbacteria bacterium]